MSPYAARFEPTIDEPWVFMTPLRLGAVPSQIRSADAFVCIEHDGSPVLRVDLFAEPDEYRAFEYTTGWQDRVVIGWGGHVWIVWPQTRAHRSISLHGAYFGSLELFEDRLLVASSERVLSIASDGWVRWISDPVGIDGVIIHRVTAEHIDGDGEHDPPGGWAPFRLHAGTGERLPLPPDP